MKKKIRKNVFETNSSSVHSLTFTTDGLEKSYLPIDENGYILTDFGSFGKDHRKYFSQEHKLSYLITCCYYISGYDINAIYDNYEFHHIQDTICEYTGAIGIKILGKIEPDIDHQSVPEYGDIGIINVWDEEMLINFIFNKNIGLETDCD